jgi:hypothetical protein
MLEFIIAFPPLLLVFLGVIQLALLAAADLVVRHAAVEGVRSAAVVLDDNPQYYGGAQRLQLADGAGGDGPRMAAVRHAVHARLAAIAPGWGWLLHLFGLGSAPTVATAIGESASRATAGSSGYLPMSTAVVFPIAPGSPELQETAVAEGTLVLRVVHLTPCAVPVVAMLLCDELTWDAERTQLVVDGGDSSVERALADLRHAPAAEWQPLLARPSLRFALLLAEASLPAQSAPYRYVSERSAP